MDLNQISIAHSHAQNQFRFDQDAFDKAVMRAEKRRALLKETRSRCRGVLGAMFDTLAAASKIVTRRWIA